MGRVPQRNGSKKTGERKGGGAEWKTSKDVKREGGPSANVRGKKKGGDGYEDRFSKKKKEKEISKGEKKKSNRKTWFSSLNIQIRKT